MVAVGLQLGLDRSELANLSTAGLMLDVGKLRVPSQLLERPGKLTETEFRAVKRHVQYSLDILSSSDGIDPRVTEAVARHHEREDGSGYPAGLGGAEVHEYAKIVALADTYEAMTHDRPHRKALSVRALLDSRDMRTFSRDVLKAFLDAMQVYPIGSLVELNSRCVCKVIDTNIDNPLKPIVREEIDARGDRVKNSRVINLQEQGNLLWVAKALDETDPRL
jgi:HD-GYP domain-containing protein (c-di-GMP phosphodiesterase class II)